MNISAEQETNQVVEAITWDVQFLLSSNPDSLTRAIKGFASATVEAEYGDQVVRGGITIAHHGPRHTNPPACSQEWAKSIMDNPIDVEVVGLSHVDLDALGGIISAIAPEYRALENSNSISEQFWDWAGFVDKHGSHRLVSMTCVGMDSPIRKDDAIIQDDMLRRLQAFWAWSHNHQCPRPNPNGPDVIDVSKYIKKALRVVFEIAYQQEIPEYLEKARREWVENNEVLERNSFVRSYDNIGLLLRRSPEFTNNMYNHGGQCYNMVIGFNETHHVIIVSTVDEIEGIDCVEIVKSLWGEKAGGRKSLAGSPRDQRMSFRDAEIAADKISGMIGGSFG